MENEKTGGVRAAEHRPLCLCILAIGALFAWWNLYHDDGFLFLSNYLNQVESCLACYGGALGAFALIVGARASWATARASLAHRPRHCPSAHWYVALHRRYGRLARWRHRRPAFHRHRLLLAAVLPHALALHTSRPPYRRSHCGSYSDLRRSGSGRMGCDGPIPPHASAHCRALPPSGIVHRLQLASSLETPRFGPKWPRSLSLCLCRDR